MGVPRENIVVWSKNGIEYFYPPPIVDKIFEVGPEIEIKDDMVSRNGVTYKKGELVEKVIGHLGSDMPMRPEFKAKLLKPIERTL